MFLIVENLKKSYKTGDVGTQALKGVGMNLDKGEIGVILGPSGSGKSTLLNIIVCISYSYLFIGLVIIYSTYEISKALSKAKINGISMNEILKCRLE